MRLLILDDMLPHGLADELAARGRPARTLEELGLQGAPDSKVVGVVGVLVTADEATAAVRARGATVALVTARPGAPRRDVVHRYAHEMATQRPGTVRRYPADVRTASSAGSSRGPA
jgi:hypothetical protein